MIKNLFRKFSISIFFLFILFFIFFSLPPRVEALDCDGFPGTGVFCDDWETLGCGVNPCPTTAMKSQQACITCFLYVIIASGIQYKCDADYPSCQAAPPPPPPPTAVCGDWVNGSCGGGSCANDERFQSRTCVLGTITYPETRCVRDSACVGGGGGGTKCGDMCASAGCNACACDNDTRSSAYSWSSLGKSSDCTTCYCGTSAGSPPPSGSCTPGEWSSSRCATCKPTRSWNANCTDYGSASTWCACASWCDPAAYAANPACGGSPIPGGFTCP